MYLPWVNALTLRCATRRVMCFSFQSICCCAVVGYSDWFALLSGRTRRIMLYPWSPHVLSSPPPFLHYSLTQSSKDHHYTIPGRPARTRQGSAIEQQVTINRKHEQSVEERHSGEVHIPGSEENE